MVNRIGFASRQILSLFAGAVVLGIAQAALGQTTMEPDPPPADAKPIDCPGGLVIGDECFQDLPGPGNPGTNPTEDPTQENPAVE